MTKITNLKFKLLSLTPFLVGGVTAGTNSLKADRPNILIVLCDDLGYADVGFNGSKDIRTPELDKLAKAGTKFSSAYVAHAFSGPSRAALMTGRYPHVIGAQYNLSDLSEDMRDGVPTSETFMSNVIQDAGYYTSAIGKWHLGYDHQFTPNERGFTDFYGFLGGGHKYFPEQYKKEYNQKLAGGAKKIHVYLIPLLHNKMVVDENEYLTDAFTRESIRAINESAKQKKPFFMYLAYNAPHVPLEAKEDDMAQFPDIKDKDRRTYAAMVYSVDRGMGEIVKALKANKQYDNTLIVFLSDNGGNIQHGADNFPLKGTKGDTWEGGFRVPMFFHWPKKVPAGKTFDYPVTALDFYPTFARLAKAKIPVDKKLDGVDIFDAVIKNKNPRADGMIYSLRYRNGFSDVSARKDDWKIVRAYRSEWKLFNITDDISEKNDLSKMHPDRLKQMVQETEKWSKTHVTPLWYNSDAEQKMWKDSGMPNYQEAFKVK